ncbi:NADPH--cytochrome reductase [Trichosporon asahii var. asahii CBS 8904]|uniref:ubiquitinyl hydrolase 1 n=1 Tax=Trichosporon asahii var. asahii (strain CBS 8904) TaxID=1220162 RepID=K1VPG9_TRIAC|nr:NADPH--cytochrome reductase [Trichosporon asahii var. asahii CBS 8904]
MEDGWCLTESDPQVFSELLRQLGVKGLQVDDLYSLDAETLAPLQPIYALIFLFKYVGGGAEDRAGVQVDALDSGVLLTCKQNKKCAVFYGSQTGTAEEFSIRLAKEAKSRFGVSSLVCDPEEYEFRNLDQIPEDKAVVFVMATYGEGEPTDNAQQLMEFLEEEEPEFSNGSTLENLNYVVFGLGNKTYEHYNAVARKLDERLTALGAKRIGERGEGDDDKALEEDYLAWKDDMWVAFAERLGVEEGGAGGFATPSSTLPCPSSLITSVIPQAICNKYGLAIGATFAPLVKGMIILLYPIAKPIALVLDYLFGAHDDGVTYRKAELKAFVALGVEDKLADEELALLGSVLEFSGKTVSSVMQAPTGHGRAAFIDSGPGLVIHESSSGMGELLPPPPGSSQARSTR